MAVWKPVLAAVLDLLIVVACAAAVLIATTGGGAIEWGSVRLTAHQLRNPFLLIALLCLIRFRFTRAVPWLGFSRWQVQDLDKQAVSAIGRASTALNRVSTAGAWRYCALLAAVVISVRFYIAWTHPGFFAGDDVEVQEMSFARLFDWQWQAWALRNSFFPMAVIHPVQSALVGIGVTGTHELVFAGRATVAVLSTASLPLLLIGSTTRGRAVGVIAMTILATSGVWLQLGATELPRPIAAVFVLAAYFIARTPGIAAAAGAGLLIGIAASFRFSEFAFLPALALHLCIERRFRDAAAGIVVAITTAAAILGLADYLYWGEPFASVRAIVDYTLVQRQSSRGYEPPWYYLSELTQWTDWVIATLAVIGMRREWRLALWILVPLLLLSSMPHHEPRYTVPLLPLVALCAAHGLVAAATTVKSSLAIALPACLAASLVFQISVRPVESHDGAVALARTVRGLGDAGVVVVQESWRWGNNLYFGKEIRVLDLPEAAMADGAAFEQSVKQLSGDWLAVRQDACDRLQCSPRLGRLGYHFQQREPSTEPHAYVVFLRSR